MNKNLLAAAIAITSISTSQASSFLSGDPVEAVADKDTAFDNPAFLLNTKNQLSFSDWSDAGYVFNAFGQKLAVHAGRSGDALDVFWGTNLEFGSLGVRTGFQLDSDSGLFDNNYLTGDGSQTDFTYLEDDGNTLLDDGTNTFSLDVSENSRVVKSSESQLAAGIVLNDLPVDATFTFILPTSNTTDMFSAVDVINTDGFTTTTYRATRTRDFEQSAKRTGGLQTSLFGRYKLNPSTYVTGGIALNNDEDTTSTKTVVTNLEVDVAGGNTTIVNQTTTNEGTTVVEDKSTTLVVGLDYRKFVGPAMFKIQPNLSYQSTSTTTTDRVVEGTFVDAVTPAANTTAAVGVTDVTLVDGSEIDAWVNMSAEFLASEKWTWRAGTSVDLLLLTNSKTTYTQNQVDQAGTGYEEDYVQVNVDDSDVQFLEDTVTIDLGFTFKPNATSVFDINLNTDNNTLQNWSANFAYTLFY